MLPIRMDILEIPRGDSSVNGRRESESLSQCLVCGSLVWSRTSDGEPECRCSIASDMWNVAKEPQTVGSAA